MNTPAEKPPSSIGNVLQGLFQFVGLAAVAASIGVAGVMGGEGMKQFRSFDRAVTVKGLATKEVRADLAVWFVSFTATGDELSAAQLKLDEDGAKIVSYLKGIGLKDEDIRLQNLQVFDRTAQTYGSAETGGARFILGQTYIVRTTDIEAMVKASQGVSELLKQGVLLGQMNGGYNPAPQYMFTKLNAIKPEMIGEATKNARTSAAQFAEDAGQGLGKMRSANQGVFEVLPRDPSLNETETPDKTVRVVSTVEYFLD
jgi:hypothetical protein